MDAADEDAQLDAVVIGAGPAGLVAALYLRRFHRNIAVLDGGDARALRIERSWNVPGFPAGIPGAELLARMREQLHDVRGRVTFARVRGLEREVTGGFRILGTEGRAWRARTVLLATGARDHEPALPGARKLRERGLLRQCPICDGHEHSGQRLVVVGQGDHGAREALFLAHFTPHVALVPFLDGCPPSAGLQQQLQDSGVAHLPGPPQAVRANDDGHGLTLVDAEGEAHAFEALYSALGCHPRAELALGLGAETDEAGNLVVDRHCMTRVAGLYAAGDVTGGLDQISVACGQAAIAATAIHNAL